MQNEKPLDFNDIEDKDLRDYNRAVVVFNLANDEGPVVASNYFMQFSAEDKRGIIDVLTVIRNKVANIDNTSPSDVEANFKDQLTLDLELPENPVVEDTIH